ncbi:MAG TPA: hypothetical protein VFE70_03685 [Candidatus Elarobacter sp.]|nr:hypothetical protein [Candidatus Elarobacter sp.]
MRPIPGLTAALAVVVLAAPGAASSTPPVTVLVAATVGDGAQQMMPAALWFKLVSDYIGPAKIVSDVESTMPDEERCKSAHAAYAVLATFDRAPRLPGIAQDTDRAYAVARFIVRNCATGVVSAIKTVRLESDPVGEAERAGPATAERQWARAVRMSLAHEPLGIIATPKVATVASSAPVVAVATSAPIVARVSRFRDGIVYLDGASRFAPSQVVVDYAAADGTPHPPIQLVIGEVQRRSVTATVLGHGTPRAGDLVSPLAAPTPSPSPTP